MKKLLALLIFCVSFATIQAQNQDYCGQHIMTEKLFEQNPQFRTEHERLDAARPAVSQLQANERVVLTIPVVVHIIAPAGTPIGTAPNLSVARVQSQIDVLNEDYRRTNSDAGNTPAEFAGIAADVEIEFCLATVDPAGNATTGIVRHEFANPTSTDDIEYNMKPVTRWDATRYMNIWTARIPSSGGGQILGYSYLPYQSMIGSAQDGLVVDDRYFGRYGSVRGRTATHEIGHYLGLNHPWGNQESCDSDDGIDDTPVTDGPNYACSTTASCGTTDMHMNYMDYVDDGCMNAFTQGQKNVMQAVLNGTAGGLGFGSRASLVNNSTTACNFEVVCADVASADVEMGFEAAENTGSWSIENTNGDSDDNGPKTWVIASNNPDINEWGSHSGDNFLIYFWNAASSADDWVFSPCIDMIQGHTYEMTFWYAAAQDADAMYPEKFEVGHATATGAASVTTILQDYGTITNYYPAYLQGSVQYTATATEVGHFGIHVYSDADMYAMQIDDINIADITNVSVTQSELNAAFTTQPNPVTNELTIQLDLREQADEMTVTVYNVLGQAVSNQVLNNVTSEQITIDMSNEMSGVYFVSLTVDDVVTTKKIVKQ